MGFEAYTVALVPRQNSPLATGQDFRGVQHLAEELQRAWPAIRVDEEELLYRPCLSAANEIFLIYQTKSELFQIMLNCYQEQITASVRFAYCNPTSVYPPFAAVIGWLMEHCRMHGHTMASDESRTLESGPQVLAALTSSMDYNRHLWQADSGTREEAALRPEEALVKFILPHTLSKSCA